MITPEQRLFSDDSELGPRRDYARGRNFGLASLLVAAKSHGVQRLIGMTLSENSGMLALARKQGDDHEPDAGSCSVAARHGGLCRRRKIGRGSYSNLAPDAWTIPVWERFFFFFALLRQASTSACTRACVAGVGPNSTR